MEISMTEYTVLTFPLGVNRTNCYFLICGSSCIIIDPADNCEFLLRKLKEKNLKLEKILLTHAHFDHILALDELRAATGAAACIYKSDDEGLTNPNYSYLTWVGKHEGMKNADILLSDNDTIDFGTGKITVLHTPGHTRGSCVYVYGSDVFCGDTVFSEGYGRTDLYGGSDEDMTQSLKKLYKSYVGYKFHPGHGNSFRLKP